MTQTIINWVLNHPSVDINLILGGGSLSLFLEKFLVKFNINSKKLAFILLHIFSLLATVATAILVHVPSVDAAGIYASLAIAASFWHRFMISGIYTKDVEPVLETLANQPAKSSSPTVPITSTTQAKMVPVIAVAPSSATDAKPFTLDPTTETTPSVPPGK